MDITTTIYNSRDLSKVSGQSVVLVRDSDLVSVQSKVSDSNGVVFFDNVPGNVSYHLVNYGNNCYKKTNASFLTADVDRISQQVLRINTTAINILQDDRDSRYSCQYCANVLNHLKKIQKLETHMYFPPANQRQLAIVDQSAVFADLIGVKIIATDKRLSLKILPKPKSLNTILGHMIKIKTQVFLELI